MLKLERLVRLGLAVTFLLVASAGNARDFFLARIGMSQAEYLSQFPGATCRNLSKKSTECFSGGGQFLTHPVNSQVLARFQQGVLQGLDLELNLDEFQRLQQEVSLQKTDYGNWSWDAPQACLPGCSEAELANKERILFTPQPTSVYVALAFYNKKLEKISDKRLALSTACSRIAVASLGAIKLLCSNRSQLHTQLETQGITLLESNGTTDTYTGDKVDRASIAIVFDAENKPIQVQHVFNASDLNQKFEAVRKVVSKNYGRSVGVTIDGARAWQWQLSDGFTITESVLDDAGGGKVLLIYRR